MSDTVEEKADNIAPVQIVSENDANTARGIDVDVSKMSLRALAEMKREDLLTMCERRKLLKGLSKSKISRLTRPQMAKKLKDYETIKEQPQEEKPQEENPTEDTGHSDVGQIDFSLLGKGCTQIFNQEDPKAFDSFAMQVVNNSNKQVINPVLAQRMENVIYYGSLVHLFVRKTLGGYHNVKNIFKSAVGKMRAKQEQKAKRENQTGI